MDDWVNWGDFIAANSDAGQIQADRDWQQRLDDEQFINSKMGELDAKAAGDTYATAMGGGQYQGHAASLGDYSAYQDLVARGNQRARQQMRRATAPAWETALVGPATDSGPSPWDSLSQRLGAQQQHWNAAARNRASYEQAQYAQQQQQQKRAAERAFAEQQAQSQRDAEEARRSRVGGRLSRDNTSGWWNPDGEESYAEYSDRVGRTYQTKNRSAWR